jgi:HK97 family phage portal protein
MPAWLNQEMVSLLLRGNGYGRVVEYDKNTYPSAIKPLSPDDVQPKRDKVTGLIMYKLRGEQELHRAYPAGDIVHQRGLTLPGGVVGLAPIEYARQGIGLGLAAEEYGGRYFGESANPSGALVTDQELSEMAAKTALQNWMKSHGNRSRIPAVLTGGMKFQPLSITPEESQFLATRAYTRVDIAQLFRVPLHMISIMDKSTSWGTGIEEQVLGLVTFTLQPWLVRLESMLTEMLPRGQFVKFNLAGLLRGRLLDRYQSYLLGRNGGWLSINDILRLEDMTPITDPAGDDHLQPLNMAPIDMVKDILTKPSADVPPPSEIPTEGAPA